MACQRKEMYGSCNHHQCPYSNETSHGYECIDIVFDSDRGYCEIGDDCLEHCQYSMTTPEQKEASRKAFELHYPIE